MPLIPFEPFRQLETFRNEMNRWMSHYFPNWAQQTFSFGPRIDVSETDREVIIEAEIPGLTKEDDVNIEVQPTQVILSGEIQRSRTARPQAQTTRIDDRQDPLPERNNDRPLPTEANYFHTERYIGQFRRLIALPAEVDDTKASAEYHNGILEIRLPKVKQDRGRRLNIRFH